MGLNNPNQQPQTQVPKNPSHSLSKTRAHLCLATAKPQRSVGRRSPTSPSTSQPKHQSTLSLCDRLLRNLAAAFRLISDHFDDASPSDISVTGRINGDIGGFHVLGYEG
jgi:hypothetical protein